MELVLEGEIITPIITKKSEFLLQGCKVRILQPRRRFFSKINSGKPMYPYSYIGYMGKIELRRKVRSKRAAKKKLPELLEIEAIGKYSNEGMGRINWLSGQLEQEKHLSPRKFPKVKIRKGLPRFLPIEFQKLIQCALLHDFFHTRKHQSKIYVEPSLEDLGLVNILREHHSHTGHPMVLELQKYDQIAARMTRTVRSPKANRYTWASQTPIDFQNLAEEITRANKQGVWKLYRFIYENKELAQLNESLQHGHSALRTHLLLMANLIVLDFIGNPNEEH
ncbi:MAG: hypothetical protein ACFFGZ_05385 [Candidatus Thorarchaeota archaeon]